MPKQIFVFTHREYVNLRQGMYLESNIVGVHSGQWSE